MCPVLNPPAPPNCSVHPAAAAGPKAWRIVGCAATAATWSRTALRAAAVWPAAVRAA
jgi:hypothetical protein